MTDQIKTEILMCEDQKSFFVNCAGPTDAPREEFEIYYRAGTNEMMNFWSTLIVQFDTKLPMEEKITLFRAMMAVCPEGKLA